MDCCLGCLKTVSNTYSIYDKIGSIQIADLVCFFLHVETSSEKLKTEFLCYDCLRTLQKCYNMKTIAQTMIRGTGNVHQHQFNLLNPNASVFQPGRRPDSPYPFACVPSPTNDGSYYSNVLHENDNGYFEASREELSGGSSSGNSKNSAELDNYSQFRENVMNSSSFSDLRTAERAQYPTTRLFSCNKENNNEQFPLVDNLLSSSVQQNSNMYEPWYTSADEEELQPQMITEEEVRAEEITMEDSEHYEHDVDDEVVYFITVG